MKGLRAVLVSLPGMGGMSLPHLRETCFSVHYNQTDDVLEVFILQDVESDTFYVKILTKMVKVLICRHFVHTVPPPPLHLEFVCTCPVRCSQATTHCSQMAMPVLRFSLIETNGSTKIFRPLSFLWTYLPKAPPASCIPKQTAGKHNNHLLAVFCVY